MNQSDLLSKNMACLLAARSSCANTNEGPTGAEGPTGPAGFAISTFSFINQGLIPVSADSLKNDVTLSPDTWYGSSSDVGYSDGVSMSFKVSALTNEIVAGLTTDPVAAIGSSPGTANIASIEYGFRLPISNLVTINNTADTSYTYTAADVFTIQYDGT